MCESACDKLLIHCQTTYSIRPFLKNALFLYACYVFLNYINYEVFGPVLGFCLVLLPLLVPNISYFNLHPLVKLSCLLKCAL